MATDLERLVVQLSADIKGYENSLRRAQGITTRQARSIESRFAQMNSRLASGAANLGRRMAAGLAAGLTVGAFTKFSDAATRIDNSLKVAGLSGDALENVYERLRASAIKNAAPIEALVELYGRASLVQKELGITGEELLGFTDKIAVALRVSGKSAAESSGALLQLSQALGSGVVRAEEFNSILEGALPIAQAAAAGLKEAGGSVAALRQLVVDGKISSEAFFRAFEAGSVILEQKVAGAQLTVSQALGNLNTSLIDAVREFNSATGASDKMAKGINNLATAISSVDVERFISRIAAARGAVEQFLGSIGNSTAMERFAEFLTGTELTKGAPISLDTVDAEKDIANVQRQIELLQQRIELNKELGIDTREAEAQLDALIVKAGQAQAVIANAATPRAYQPGTPGDPNALAQRPTLGVAKVKPVSLNDFTLPSSGGAAKKIKDEFDAARDGFADMLGYTEAYREEQQRVNQTLEDFGDLATNVATSLATAFADGKLEAQELIPILQNVVTELIRMATTAGGLGNLFSVFGGGFNPTAGGFAQMLGFAGGGYTGNGGKYQPKGVVHGGEYVFSKAAVQRAGVGNLEAMHRSLKGYAGGGLVAPTLPRMGAGPAAQPGIADVRVWVDKDGNWQAAVERISRGQAQMVTANGLKAYDKGKQRQQMTGG